ncbi:Ipi1_N domain-containing protein [Cephalotus follicularis]|uniref:Ipi1_N domain-containing protein n=1 Tax=Cephalotus follicularis TaxID=3775 RepID=A0A1Q3ANW9_CEPFO|nr:Ipi1_N domain-containing protein [Cephalotus follicularis]
MTRSKAPSKKQQKRGIDFKKIKRKIGRKLPPAKNATNTEIKSKAIVLPEQSVASEKTGLAVSKKGLTLKELLQQTSHYSSKVRRDGLMGIKDLITRYPSELMLHRYAIIEKLRERVSDDDRVVRETLFQLLKTVVFPACKEDNRGPFVSLMMTYIFNAMTHLAIDVRLMAFNFFDLVMQFYPSCFSLYTEKILQNYEDILHKNQFYIEEKGKLKNVLDGLVRCLSLLPCDKKEIYSCEKNVAGQGILQAFESDVPTETSAFSIITEKLKDLVPVLVNCFQDFIPLVHTTLPLDAQSFDCMLSILKSIDLAVRFFFYGIHKGKPVSQLPIEEPDVTMWDQSISLVLKKLLSVFPVNPKHHLSERGDDRYFILNIMITVIFLHCSECICPPAALLEKYLDFIESALLGKICSATRSGKAAWEKHLLLLLPFISKLVFQLERNWRSHLLQAFTQTFKVCNPESSLKLACLSTIEEIVIPGKDTAFPGSSNPEILDFQIIWIRELPLLLNLLGDKLPSSSQYVLLLLLRLGQCASLNSSLEWEYNNLQYSLLEFYGTCQEGDIYYGPFIRLPRDTQELSICCLYYFSHLDSLLLKSIASSCLCPELEPFVLFRIIEVLHSAYKAGHIQIADHISFFVTLLTCFKVFPEDRHPAAESDEKISNPGTFKSLTSVVCSSLSQMGDDSLVFQIVEKVLIEKISLKPPVDNACAMLRMLSMLDSKPTRLSGQSIITLSNFVAGYLVDVVQRIPEDDDEPTVSTYRYYLLPCFFFFDRSYQLLRLVLDALLSFITESRSPHLSHTCTQYAKDHSGRMVAIASVLVLMHKDVKVREIFSSFKAEIKLLLQSMFSFQSSEAVHMDIEERHRIKCAYDRLQIVTKYGT